MPGQHSTIAANCTQCGERFAARREKVVRHERVFCSQACWFKFRKTRQRPLVDRFWEKVERTEGCWLWTGQRNTKGYGILMERGDPGFHHSAHRFSYALHFGPIPDALMVCHHCDNPRCVRPDHLFLGTAADNAHDRDRKGRTARRRTAHPS